jgi:hypothetical protein
MEAIFSWGHQSPSFHETQEFSKGHYVAKVCFNLNLLHTNKLKVVSGGTVDDWNPLLSKILQPSLAAALAHFNNLLLKRPSEFNNNESLEEAQCLLSQSHTAAPWNNFKKQGIR